MLAGIAVDHYVRMERGSLGGAPESVLDTVARALQLDEAEREHLFVLPRAAGSGRRRRTSVPTSASASVQQVLDCVPRPAARYSHVTAVMLGPSAVGTTPQPAAFWSPALWELL